MSALAEALVAAQAELPCALGKDADGQIQSRTYRYLTLDKLIAETRPILNKHGLTIVQSPTTLMRGEEERIPALRTEIIFAGTDGTDGEWMESVSPRFPWDSWSARQADRSSFTISSRGFTAAVTWRTTSCRSARSTTATLRSATRRPLERSSRPSRARSTPTWCRPGARITRSARTGSAMSADRVAASGVNRAGRLIAFKRRAAGEGDT